LDLGYDSYNKTIHGKGSHFFSIAFAVSISQPFFPVAVIVALSLGKAKLLCHCFVLGKAKGKARQRKPRCFVFQIPAWELTKGI